MGKLSRKFYLCLCVVIVSIIILNLNASSIIFAQNAADAETVNYLGVEKCKSCHPAEYQDYSQRKFSKSWRVLKMRGETKNSECLKCHVTGSGKPSGFISEEETPHLTGKQCEACHGPGGKHVADPGNAEIRKKLLVSKQNKNVCIECHLCMTTHRGGGF